MLELFVGFLVLSLFILVSVKIFIAITGYGDWLTKLMALFLGFMLSEEVMVVEEEESGEGDT